MSVKIVPTFLLKGVDPKVVLSQYQKGFFNREPVEKSPIKEGASNFFRRKYSTDVNDGVFKINNKNNFNIIIATTGHELCKNFPEDKLGGRCRMCNRDFTHERTGIPVAHDVCTLASEEGMLEIYNVFWTHGVFCNDRCVYGFLDSFKDPYPNSLAWLKTMHSIRYPNDRDFRPCNDPFLLKINGGSLEDEEWETQYFSPIGNVLLIPVKTEYFKDPDIRKVIETKY